VLEEGRIVAEGRHSDLMRSSERYRYVISSLEDSVVGEGAL
jgi:ATP-binding cassette subfamily B protein